MYITATTQIGIQYESCAGQRVLDFPVGDNAKTERSGQARSPWHGAATAPAIPHQHQTAWLLRPGILSNPMSQNAPPHTPKKQGHRRAPGLEELSKLELATRGIVFQSLHTRIKEPPRPLNVEYCPEKTFYAENIFVPSTLNFLRLSYTQTERPFQSEVTGDPSSTKTRSMARSRFQPRTIHLLQVSGQHK